MKVLVQFWETPNGSERTALSKNQEAVNQEKSEVASDGEPLVPVGEPTAITIPDDSPFAEMVEHQGTVYLNEDELDIVYSSPEFQ